MKIPENENIIKVEDNIYILLAPQKGQYPFCHCFLFTGEENIMIDAGCDEKLITIVDKYIGIDVLVISHSHPDHIRRWDTLSQKKVIIPVETPDSVHNIESLGKRFTGTTERGKHWARVVGEPNNLQPLRIPDERYSDGHVFDTGKIRIHAVHTPGHLDDHYCFFENKAGTLITTDIDFSSFGPWYGNPEGRIKPFLYSVKKIMELPYKRVCTSHKLPHEGDASDKFNAFITAFERQKNEILFSIGNGKSLHEITVGSPFYKNRFMDPLLQYVFEEHMAYENLSLLIEEGKVKCDNDMYYSLT